MRSFNHTEIERKIFFDPELVFFIDNSIDRDALIFKLTEELANKGKIAAQAPFYNAVLEREKLTSTGIGHGIAIPHAKLADLEEFFIAIALLREKGIDWGAIDGSEVRIVLLIGGPTNRQADYLHILSEITQILQKEGIQEKLLLSHSSEDVVKHLSL